MTEPALPTHQLPLDVTVLRVPRSLTVALLVVAGIHVADLLPTAAVGALPTCALLLIASCLVARCDANRRDSQTESLDRPTRQHYRMETICLLLASFLLGAGWWHVRGQTNDARDIRQLLADGELDEDTPIRLNAVVTSIPALDSVIDGHRVQQSRYQQPRTMFLAEVESIVVNNSPTAVRGICRVMIEGEATTLRWGDRIQVTGQLNETPPPQNPGQFDYARLMARNRVSAMLFVKHPAAVTVTEPEAAWHPRRILSDLRQQSVSLMRTTLSPDNRATAEALLLGNRGHMTPDDEREYVSSGTMHLLAISGLHVGILAVFLLRVFHLLLLPRTQSLFLAGTVCVLYMLLTDLRPSVVRATAFIVLAMIGELLRREVRMGSLIGTTSLLLLICDPSIAFDTGAWLSFLAVGALGWVSFRQRPPTDRPAPLDATDWREQLRETTDSARRWLTGSYRQMLAVTLLSAPLVAVQFHLVSLTGMVINIVMIPFTTLVLIAGYLFIGVGLLVPKSAWVLSWPFGCALSVLNGCVSVAADVRTGFIAIPDLPAWFLWVFYALLLGSALARRSVVRRALRISLLLFVIVQLWLVCQRPAGDGLTLTALSIGHGNAVVVETPDGRVLLFDAGALNRGERTADTICRFLWHRGHRMIDAIVISHADADHYNAIGSLLDRMPVGQLITTTEFAQSSAPDVQRVLNEAGRLDIPVLLAKHGDSAQAGDCRIDFLQADLSSGDDDLDNQRSLVAVLTYRQSRLCLPGDLDGEGQRQLLTSIPRCEVLVCPHHGSLHSNPREFAQTVQAETVIVSARNDALNDAMTAIYAPAVPLFTSRSGAITVHVDDSGRTVSEFIAR